jgi:hypothetical protein
MGKWDWKNDRQIHFAIGLAVLVLACKWLITGSLLRSIEVLQGGVTTNVWDSTGNVESVPVSTFLEGWLPLIFDFVITLVVAIGAKIVAGSLTLFGGVRSTVSAPVVEVSDAVPSDEKAQALAWAQQLAIAAGANDKAVGDEVWAKLRDYQLRKEIAAAVAKNDMESADSLLAELTGRKATKRGSNVQ